MRYSKTLTALGLFIALACLAQIPYHNSLVWRANQWVPSSGPTNCGTIHTNIITWGARVVANGGAAVSANTSNAVNCFYLGLIDDGLINSMDMVNCVVPDNLIAAATPLIPFSASGTDYSYWDNNFAAGDLSTNGVAGNGTSKYMDTYLIPVISSKLTATSGGITVYWAPSTPANMAFSAADARCYGVPNYSILGLARADGDVYFNCYGNLAANINVDFLIGRLPATNWYGFISCSRTANNAISMYAANSTNSFYNVTNGNGSASSTTTNIVTKLAAWAQRDGFGVLGAYSKRTMSFVAVHGGLSSANTQKLYNRVYSLRYQLNGGY